MLTLIQLLIFTSYVTFLLIKFKGTLPSISDSWYKLEGLTKYLFTVFCWGLAIPLLYQGNGTTLLFFLSGSCLAFVGVDTMFKDKDFTKYIHFIGAGAAITLAFLGIGVEYHSWIPIIFCALSIIALKLLKVKNFTWWTEISSFLFIIVGLFIK